MSESYNFIKSPIGGMSHKIYLINGYDCIKIGRNKLTTPIRLISNHMYFLEITLRFLIKVEIKIHIIHTIRCKSMANTPCLKEMWFLKLPNSNGYIIENTINTQLIKSINNHLAMRYLSLDSSYINNKYFSFNDSKFNIFNVNQHVMINNPKQLNA